MYYKITLLSLIGTMMITFCIGQDEKSFTGIILDQQTGLSIQGAYVSTTSKTANAISNGEGSFTIMISGNNIGQDSLVIDALGYSRMVISLSQIPVEPIKLAPITYVLPDVTVASYHTDWSDFIKKVGANIKGAKIPFESEIQKTITVSTNLNPPTKYKINGFSHSEGLTQETFTSYLRGLTFWYTVTSSKIEDSTEFTGCNESGKPEVFTEFENGKFQWLYKLYSSTGDVIADYKIETITQFGGDSVYVVKYLPKKEETNKVVRTLNSASDNGMFSFFSLEKTLFVRKKDFRLLRIDFVQRPGNISASTKKHVKAINEISGTVGFQYFNGTPHPAYIYEKYLYQDVRGNEIERTDSCYYSNIKMINLSTEDLKKKYQIVNIYRGYPIRSVQLQSKEKVGPFWFVPMLK